MNFSQEEVVESSQSGGPISSGRRRRGRPSNGTQRGQPKRSSQRNKQPLPVDSADWSTSVLLEIPQTDSEETSAGNLSGSLFTGHQDLLRQYQNHEQELQQRDTLLEQVLEQSRKACEQLKLQNSTSQSSQQQIGVNQQNSRPSLINLQGLEVECGQEISQNQLSSKRPLVIPKDVSCQTTINLQDAGVQCSEPKTTLCNASVQLSPISQKRSSQNVATQSSPTGQPKRPRISTATNTVQLQQTSSSVQTSRIETCDVAIQKYHSTRVREVAAQTDGEDLSQPPRRTVSRRNVSIQHRSNGTFDLNVANSVGLGIALRCDPARLQRVLAKMAAEQHNHSRNTSSEVDSSSSGNSEMQGYGREGMELFGPNDPYFQHYGYFMDDEGGRDDGETDIGSSTRTSELLEQEVSSFAEEEFID